MTHAHRNPRRFSPPHIEPLEPRRLLAGNFGFVAPFGDKETIDSANDVVVDPATGDIYVMGSFEGTIDVDPSKNRKVTLKNVGTERNIFVVKYQPNSKVIWARRFGGNDDDLGRKIALGPDGSVFVGAQVDGSFTLSTPGKSIPVKSQGHGDALVFKLSPEGELRWAANIGGDQGDDVTALAVDNNGEVYWAGSIRLEGDIDPGPKEKHIVTEGVDDTFIEKLNGSNGALRWAQIFGEQNTREEPRALIPDNSGHILATGFFNQSVDFARNQPGFDVESSGDDDVYLARLTTKSGKFDWIKTFGGDKDDRVFEAKAAPNGDVVLTGEFRETADFDPGKSVTNLTCDADVDAFVARYTPAGNLVWARDFGFNEELSNDSDDESNVRGRGVAVDPAGNVYAVGTMTEGVADFRSGPGQALLVVDKDNDAEAFRFDTNNIFDDERQPTDGYIAKLDSTGKLLYAKHFGGEEGSVRAQAVASDAVGNAFIAGAFVDVADFDPGSKQVIRHTKEDHDDSDAYLLKLLQ